MNTHDVNVRLAGWSVGAGLPLLPAVLPTSHPSPTAPTTSAAGRRSLRATLARWSVTRRART